MAKVPQVDKEFAALIPPLAPEELAQLEANLLADGCRDPLVTWQGLLLDGHNRLQICQKHNLAFNTADIVLAERDAAMVWIIRNQFGRRNLTPFVRSELALKLEPILKRNADRVKVEAAQMRQDEIRAIQTKIQANEVSGIDIVLAEGRLKELRGEPGRRSKQDATLVYFVRSHDKVKIGASYDPEARLKQILTTNPDAVLLGTIPGGIAIEKSLHERFAAYRASGEWFRADQSVIDDIGLVLSGVAEFCNSTPAHVRAEVAKQAGVSHDTIAKAKLIAAHAPEEVKEKLRRGETSINAEAAAIKKEQNLKLRQARVEAETRPLAAQLSTVTLAVATEWICNQKPADLILTDPPYLTEGVNISAAVAQCLKSLKPTGSAYVFIGTTPQEVATYLAIDYSPLELTQLLVWNYNNTGQRQPIERYTSNYQLCLYLRGPKAGPLIRPSDGTWQYACQTVNAPDGRMGDRFHKWQKPIELIERLIRNSTHEGDLVLDPFCGSGTTLVAAAKLGRVAAGCDIDGDAIALCVSRGCNEV